MDTGPIIILANDQKCCYYQSSIQYIARIITTILHHNRDTTELNKRYSVEGLLTELEKIKIMILPDGEKITTEITKKQREILDALHMCA